MPTAFVHSRSSAARVGGEAMETFLNAGPGLAPLAMVTNEAGTDVMGNFDRVSDLLRGSPLPDNVKGELFNSTLSLCGLRYDAGQIAQMHRRLAMNLEKDSIYYQFVLDRGEARGRLRESRKMLTRQVSKKFEVERETIEAALDAIEDLERLERMGDRIFEAESWEDLLATE